MRIAPFIVAMALLAIPPTLAAQEHIGCTEQANTNPLRVTVPVAVLDHLEGLSSSVFVHAYLIRLIAHDDAGTHRLSVCARRFRDTELRDLPGLRQSLPDAVEIINALRAAAEEQRLRTQLTDSTKFGDLVARLLADRSPAVVNASAEQIVAAAATVCPSNSGAVCNAVHAAVSQIGALQQARSRMEAAEGQSRLAAETVEQWNVELLAPLSALAADSISLEQLRAMDPPPAPTALAELDTRLSGWRERVRVLTDTLKLARSRADSLGNLHATAVEAVQRAESDLAAVLENLDRQFKAGGIQVGQVMVIAGTPIQTFMPDVADPPELAIDGNPAARSANLLLELTDFIIARARREAVNSFIINLHRLARREPLLQRGFRDTWGLMNSLSTRSDSVLDAVEVGRIPLEVWRATLAGDFVVLPVSLIDAGPGVICQQQESAEERTGRAPTAAPAACSANAAVLRPLVPAARRLLAGERIFDVLSDASSFASSSGPDLPEGWHRLSQALTIVGALAGTYLAQGFAATADPIKHPYVLTARSLTQVPKVQRDAFMRLLLVRAIPSTERILPIDEGAYRNALEGTVRLFERIASRQSSGDSSATEPGWVLRNSFEALGASFDFAQSFLPAEDIVRFDSIRARWMVVSGTLEPLVSGNFGLALSRTVVLLRDVRGRDVPAPLITFAALASALSEARTGEQVRVAFDAAASPVGGWQGKRYGEGGASITAFPGLAGGYEYVLKEEGDPEEVSTHVRALGASLPIGVELQFTLRSDSPAMTSRCVVCGVGLFLPLIDLGALLSYRLDSPSSVDAEPNASIRQVFAPGAYVSLPITRSVPLTLLFGAQLMPSLRSVQAPEGTVNRSAIRYGISIGMDILLFDF